MTVPLTTHKTQIRSANTLRSNFGKLDISKSACNYFLYSFTEQYDNNENLDLLSQVELGKPLVRQTRL